jgi:hypothetical protein
VIKYYPTPVSSASVSMGYSRMAGSNPTESESGGKRRSHTPMSRQGRPALRYCAWTAVIPMLRFKPDFRAWAKELRERPVHKNPLAKREVVGAVLNRLLRLAFTLVKKRAFYQTPTAQVTNWEVVTTYQVGRETPRFLLGDHLSKPVHKTWCPCPPGQTRMKYDGTFS